MAKTAIDTLRDKYTITTGNDPGALDGPAIVAALQAHADAQIARGAKVRGSASRADRRDYMRSDDAVSDALDTLRVKIAAADFAASLGRRPNGERVPPPKAIEGNVTGATLGTAPDVNA